MVKVTLQSFPLKKISRNSIGQLPRRPSFFVIFCCCCSFLGWVYVLIAVWCLVESVFTCHLSGLQPISKQEKVWIEMEVIFFSSFFFSNNINFTVFYGYHRTITLWFSFISFNFLLWKNVTKMFRKNERFSLSVRTANFQVLFLLSVVELSGK